MSDNLISIVLPCYNASETIKDTLESIWQQEYKNFELIIINDGSTDMSLELIKEFQENVDFTIRIISRENRGFLQSLVEGIEVSNGSFIARVDSDDIWLPYHLSTLMNEFNNDPTCVLIGSEAVKIDKEGNDLGIYKVPHEHKEIVKVMHKDNPFIHSSVMFRKKIYEKTNGYLIGNDELSKHIADYNLWFELSKYGRTKNVKQPTIHYRYLENSMSRKMDLCSNYRARLMMMKKVHQFYCKHYLYSYMYQSIVRLKLLVNCSKGK